MSSPPSTLGQYQIIREIARSNDIVYEAYDPLMNRRVAIKELMMPPGSTPQQMEDRIGRFKREAQAAGTLNHPNIMTVYSFAEDAGHTFMAMEYLDGQTLRNELDARGAIPTDRAIEIAVSVLSALEHAHSKGVIHRDIKPDNIQILSTGQIKITDFGIARLTFQPNLTMDGQVFGTPSYMSPEQVVGKDIDARSDIFSVGVMLYEMLVGQKPFTGDSVVSTTYAIMNKDPDPPANVAWPLWSVISRAIEKSPSMRWASAAEMLQALEDAADPTKGVLPVVDPSVPPGYHPASNPYGVSPGAPPIAAMYGGPSTSPFNPYAPVPPAANPYAAQYQPSPTQSPLTFPYNPFQGPGGAYAPHVPGMPPPGQPVYYPPPPKRPLFSPDQVWFVKRVVIAIVIVLSLFALAFVLLQAVFTEMGKMDTSQSPPAAEQKAVQEAQTAQKDVQQNRLPEAEDQLGKAIGSDPTNPAYFSQQGSTFVAQAVKDQQESQFDEAALLYSEGADDYSKASDRETTDDARRSDSDSAVKAAINAGNMVLLSPSPAPESLLRSTAAVEMAIQVASPDERATLIDIRDRLRAR